jgi:hypothetical protein
LFAARRGVGDPRQVAQRRDRHVELVVELEGLGVAGEVVVAVGAGGPGRDHDVGGVRKPPRLPGVQLRTPQLASRLFLGAELDQCAPEGAPVGVVGVGDELEVTGTRDRRPVQGPRELPDEHVADLGGVERVEDRAGVDLLLGGEDADASLRPLGQALGRREAELAVDQRTVRIVVVREPVGELEVAGARDLAHRGHGRDVAPGLSPGPTGATSGRSRVDTAPRSATSISRAIVVPRPRRSARPDASDPCVRWRSARADARGGGGLFAAPDPAESSSREVIAETFALAAGRW